MKSMKLFVTSALLVAAGALSSFTFAEAIEPIEANDFVDEASAKGIAEIETSRLALKESESNEVRQFAKMMIDEHTAANKELKTIARQKNLEVSDDATIMSKAKGLILKMRDGDSFDVAYANNQVEAHEATVELFQRAAHTDDPQVRAFAAKTLPKLQHHLQEARELAASTKIVEESDDNDLTTDRGVGTVPATTRTN